jgi:hypothetical protein
MLVKYVNHRQWVVSVPTYLYLLCFDPLGRCPSEALPFVVFHDYLHTALNSLKKYCNEEPE